MVVLNARLVPLLLHAMVAGCAPPPAAAPSNSEPQDAGRAERRGRLPPEVIQRIVRVHYGLFRRCYEEGLGRDPKLRGRVSVRFVIGTDGTVADVANVDSTLSDLVVIRCIVRAYGTLTFPQPEGGGTVSVVYPIMFSPGD